VTDIGHWAFPVTLDASGHPAVVEQDSLDHLADQVAVALSTPVGQGTPLRPNWGTTGLEFRQQPLDLEQLADEVTELVPGAQTLMEDDPALLLEAVELGAAKVNVYVSTGG
jgi:phage baseplate assembly protein W